MVGIRIWISQEILSTLGIHTEGEVSVCPPPYAKKRFPAPLAPGLAQMWSKPPQHFGPPRGLEATDTQLPNAPVSQATSHSSKGGVEGGVWHKASVSDCLPLAAPIGLSPPLILTLCGSERVLVVSTEPPDDLSCLTTPGFGRPGGEGGLVSGSEPGQPPRRPCPVGPCCAAVPHSMEHLRSAMPKTASDPSAWAPVSPGQPEGRPSQTQERQGPLRPGLAHRTSKPHRNAFPLNKGCVLLVTFVDHSTTKPKALAAARPLPGAWGAGGIGGGSPH